MADNASIELSIAAHYVPSRVSYLDRVLDAILTWSMDIVSVTLITNDLALGNEGSIRARVQAFAERGYILTIEKAQDMLHPWHLTWWHKKRLQSWFDEGGDPRDLFIYIEDDIAISKENIQYFLSALPEAKANGFIPGFLRYEMKGRVKMSTDFLGPDIIAQERQTVLADKVYVNPKFPYWAGFALDRELCAEYLASDSANLASAEKKPQAERHSCRVLSAWGLCYENIPQGWTSRYAVPIEGTRVDERCLVWHTAENYSKSKQYSFGTVPIENVFLPNAPSSYARLAMWKAGSLLRRLQNKAKREFTNLRGGANDTSVPSLGALDQAMRAQRQASASE